jgi:tetratricopeptide (TPR) repeat protein
MTRLGLTQAGRRAPLADRAAAPSAWVGPVVWLQVLRNRTDGPSHGRPLDALAAKAAAFGGRVVERDAAGLLVGFGLEPHEDAPSRAAHVALAIQAAARRAAGEDPTLPPIRVALHAAPLPIGTGTTVLAPDDPVRAVLERLGAEVGSTSILVSDTLAPHLERRFTLAPVDSTSGQPTGARRLVGLDPTGLGLAGRILSRFVGRDQELAALEHWLERVATGAGQAVVLMGEPGAGKSRLLYEFRRRVALSAAIWLEGRCVSSATAAPYGPLMEAGRQALGVKEDDDPDVVAAAVREHAKGLGLDPEAHAPYLQALLGSTAAASSLRELSPEAIRIRTFEALHRLWLGTSLARPLVLAVEDLHWIDPTSAAYLAAFVERLAGARILLVATARPGPGTAWLSHSHASQLALPPLSAADSLAVIRSIAGLDHLPERTATSIVDRADGNPFFLEELSWSALGPEPDAVEGIAPGSIVDVLRVRIERLPDSPRRVLTTASVLGREVPLDLLRAVAPDPDTLDVDVAALKRREMLHDQPGSGEPTLVFKHALTQEAAYGSLPATERRTLHARAAEALESLHADRLPHVEEQIAHHYSRTDRAERAVHYLVRVAQRASRSYALAETVAALRGARGHAERLPPGQARDRTILGICVRQGLPLLLLGRTTEFLDLFLPEASRLERLGDQALASHYHAWVALAYNQVGDHVQGVPHGERSLETARAIDDPVAIGRAHYLLAVAAYWASRYRDGIAHGHAAEASLERAGNRFWGGHVQWSLGLNHAALGEFDRALEAVDKLQEAAEHTGDPRMRSFAAMKRGLFRALGGWGAEAVAACQEGLRLAPDPFNVGMALMLLGHAHVENDEPARAIECLERAVRELREAGIRTSEGWMEGYLAEAYLGQGDIDRARAAAERAVAVTSAARYPYGLGVALRALGRVALASGDTAGSQIHLKAALRTFADIDARREIGCTHLRLAEVAHARGDPEEAAAHLRDAHARLAALPLAQLAGRAVALADAFRVSL